MLHVLSPLKVQNQILTLIHKCVEELLFHYNSCLLFDFYFPFATNALLLLSYVIKQYY